jgi:hypothetical protein
MSDVKIPEDLREEYYEYKHCAARDSVGFYLQRLVYLIERIAQQEAELRILARLEAIRNTRQGGESK